MKNGILLVNLNNINNSSLDKFSDLYEYAFIEGINDIYFLSNGILEGNDSLSKLVNSIPNCGNVFTTHLFFNVDDYINLCPNDFQRALENRDGIEVVLNGSLKLCANDKTINIYNDLSYDDISDYTSVKTSSSDVINIFSSSNKNGFDRSNLPIGRNKIFIGPFNNSDTFNASIVSVDDTEIIYSTISSSNDKFEKSYVYSYGFSDKKGFERVKKA